LSMFYNSSKSGSMFRKLFVLTLLFIFFVAYGQSCELDNVGKCDEIKDFDEKAKCHIDVAQEYAKKYVETKDDACLIKAKDECLQILSDTKELAKDKNDCEELEKVFSEHPTSDYVIPCIEAIVDISGSDYACAFLPNVFRDDPTFCYDPAYTPNSETCVAVGKCAGECGEWICELHSKIAKAKIDECYAIPNEGGGDVHLCPVILILFIPFLALPNSKHKHQLLKNLS